MKYIWKLIKNNKNIIAYLFWGVCTTLVNVFAYYIFVIRFSFSNIIGTIYAWLLSVVFAYITNREFVFDKSSKSIIREFVLFFIARLSTGVLDVIMMFVFVDIMEAHNLVCKCVVNIVVIIMNYIASKYIIFE